MKVQISSKYKMNWLSGYRDVFERAGWSVEITTQPIYKNGVDLYILMWLDAETMDFINIYKGCKKMLFIRRYEFYSHNIENTDFDSVNKVVVLNEYFYEMVKARANVIAKIIYNGVVLSNWTYRQRAPGPKIAMIGYINQRKNLSMALQILFCLPENYTLHIAGGLQNVETDTYLYNLARESGLTDRVKLYGNVDDIDSWLEDKDYLLNTSISEGCPNSVIEAMAKGIKPLVHNWPGASVLFSDYVFNTVGGAANMILKGDYNSEHYRKDAETRFGPEQYNKILYLAKEIVDA
jgi:glycosyltransferase involved in cell wall biosynthesis